MDLIEHIKTAPDLKLKPNVLLQDPEIPYVYQRRASLMMVARPRLVLGDDVGLGKTLETVVALSYLRVRNPGMKTLIFTEKSTLRQWAKEISWLTPGMSTQIITADSATPKGRKVAFSKMSADITITTYSLLYKDRDAMMRGLGKDYTLVFDEPPFRNPDSQGSKIAREMSFEAARCYGLTATVVEGRLEDAFGIYSVIWPGLFPSKAFFQKSFCNVKRVFWNKPWPVKVIGYKNLGQFRAHIEPGFYGRLASNPEVEQALPEVITKDVPVQMGAAQSKLVKRVQDDLVMFTDEGVEELMAVTALIRAQEMVNLPAIHGEKAPSAKIEALEEMLLGSLSDSRTLVFSKSKKSLVALQEQFSAKGLPVKLLVGGMSKGEREGVQDWFQDTTPGPRVLLLNQAGGRAINLQKGGHIIFLDMPWTYGLYRQLIGRIRRTGSEHQRVVVWRLLAEHPEKPRATVDHHTLKHVVRGHKVFSALTGDAETVESTEQGKAAILASLMTETESQDDLDAEELIMEELGL